jgi:hypothetical protein
MHPRNNGGTITIRDVTRTAVAMERLVKRVIAEMNSRNNRKSVFSLRSLLRDYRKAKEDRLRQLSFETPACQDMNLRREELSEMR